MINVARNLFKRPEAEEKEEENNIQFAKSTFSPMLTKG